MLPPNVGARDTHNNIIHLSQNLRHGRIRLIGGDQHDMRPMSPNDGRVLLSCDINKFVAFVRAPSWEEKHQVPTGTRIWDPIEPDPRLRSCSAPVALASIDPIEAAGLSVRSTRPSNVSLLFVFVC